MQVKTVTYKRVKNLGNYESGTLSAFAELEENEDEFEAIVQLKAIVHQGLGIIDIPEVPEDYKSEESNDNLSDWMSPDQDF